MKLRLQVLIVSLAIVLGISAMSSVILEYVEQIETKNEIAKVEEEEQKKLAEEEARKADEEAKLAAKIESLKKYDSTEDYYNGLALVRKGSKYGYIDNNGIEIIPIQYEFASNFINKYSKVKKDGKWGYIDTEGKVIIPIEYAFCGEVSNGIVAVGNSGKYGFIAIDGTTVCELLYDKVEPFNKYGSAKVVLDGKWGLIDEYGNVTEAIVNEYKEENQDFTGEWYGTETHSSKAGVVRITGQIATSFNFEIEAKYFSKKGSISGTANITKPNEAEYKYEYGGLFDVITFKIIDEGLVVSSKTGGHCGMDNDLTVNGTYTNDVPKYTNDNIMDRLFDNNEKLFARIKNAISEELYDSYFVYGFKNGEYKVKDLDEESAVIKGTLYTVSIPTLERDFKLLVGDKYIYFYAKYQNVYRTDDPDRQLQGKMPSAIAFDEL